MHWVHANAEKVQSAQLARVSASFLRLRPRLLLPFGPVLLALMWQADVPRWQMLAIGLVFVSMLGAFSFEAWSLRRAPVSGHAFCTSLVLTSLGLAALCSFSGGPRSPFLALLFAPLGIAFAAFGKDRRTAFVFASYVLVLGYLSISQTLWSWPLPERVARFIAVFAAILASVLLYFGVTGLAVAYRETAHNLELARADVVRSAQEQTQHLQQLGSRVAHELKNPLAAIKGLVQLLALPQSESAAQRSAERFEVVLQEVTRMEAILREYLNFGRPMGNLELETQPLSPFLEALLRLLEGEAAAKGVELDLQCPSLELRFDSSRLRQALLNLSQNALSAMPSGGRLRFQVANSDDAVELSLEDTGLGMTPEVLARVKEPYFTRQPGGTGLGVVIADSIVREHGGVLHFESATGSGTRAVLTLPRAGRNGS